jgi:hypothetical protein
MRQKPDMRRALSISIVLLGLSIASCGGDDADPTSTSTSTTAETATTVTAPSTTATAPDTTTTSQGSTTTTSEATTTTVATSTTLAGEPIEFGPASGDVLMVIGVRNDDVLNLRAGPGTSAAILVGIPPTTSDLVALGNTRQLPRSFWIEVDHDGTEGWVDMSYVGYEGSVDDRTSEIVDALDGIPTGVTVSDLGEMAAETFASEEPESRLVQVTPVTSGDLHEITYDVIGLGDDSVLGLRVHVFAEETDEGFSLDSAEVTVICGRGVDEAGLCT